MGQVNKVLLEVFSLGHLFISSPENNFNISLKLFLCLFYFFFRATEAEITEVEVEPATCFGSSQIEVLNTKPDYQKILQNHSKIFDCMELVVSWLLFIFG